MSDPDIQQPAIEWTTRFPGNAGWYWVYQALPKGNGESFFPVWIESATSLPNYAKAFYGPLEPPAMPDTLKPLEYQTKAAEGDSEQE